MKASIKLRRTLQHALRPVLSVLSPESCWADGEGDVAFGLSEQKRMEIAAMVARRYCFHCGLNVGPYETHDAKNPCGRCGTRDVGVTRIARVGTRLTSRW